MSAIKWWRDVINNQAGIGRLIDHWHPSSGALRSKRKGMKITAPGAQKLCDSISKGIVKKHESLLPREDFEKAVKERDHKKIIKICNEAWFGIPESEEARYLPSFEALCDACSEWDPEIPGGSIETGEDLKEAIIFRDALGGRINALDGEELAMLTALEVEIDDYQRLHPG